MATVAELEAELAEYRAAKKEILKAPLKATVGDDSYDNTGRLKALNEEIARVQDELRVQKGLVDCSTGRRVV